MAPFILTTLIYAVRGNRVLMMFRHKEPNLGLWVAPGGKIHADESPREGAIRELAEETGLQAVNPALRAVITEISPRPDWQWMMFVYRTDVADGEATGDDREGRLGWFDIDEVPSLPVPEADALFYPLVMSSEPPVELKFVYDADLHLVRWDRHPVTSQRLEA